MGAFRQSGELGCQLLVEPRSAHPSDLAAIDKLHGMGTDGVILPPPMCDDPDVLGRMEQAGVPMLGFATADPRGQDSAVMIDDVVGARLTTEHLLSLSHRDIAFIRGDPNHSPALRREEAFRAAMAAADVRVKPEWIADGDCSYLWCGESSHALDLHVAVLELVLVLLLEEHVMLGDIHAGAELGPSGAELVGDVAPGLGGGGMVRLEEDLPDGGGDHGVQHQNLGALRSSLAALAESPPDR